MITLLLFFHSGDFIGDLSLAWVKASVCKKL